jgi:hypothetical protein
MPVGLRIRLVIFVALAAIAAALSVKQELQRTGKPGR